MKLTVAVLLSMLFGSMMVVELRSEPDAVEQPSEPVVQNAPQRRSIYSMREEFEKKRARKDKERLERAESKRQQDADRKKAEEERRRAREAEILEIQRKLKESHGGGGSTTEPRNRQKDDEDIKKAREEATLRVQRRLKESGKREKNTSNPQEPLTESLASSAAEKSLSADIEAKILSNKETQGASVDPFNIPDQELRLQIDAFDNNAAFESALGTLGDEPKDQYMNPPTTMSDARDIEDTSLQQDITAISNSMPNTVDVSHHETDATNSALSKVSVALSQTGDVVMSIESQRDFKDPEIFEARDTLPRVGAIKLTRKPDASDSIVQEQTKSPTNPVLESDHESSIIDETHINALHPVEQPMLDPSVSVIQKDDKDILIQSVEPALPITTQENVAIYSQLESISNEHELRPLVDSGILNSTAPASEMELNISDNSNGDSSSSSVIDIEAKIANAAPDDSFLQSNGRMQTLDLQHAHISREIPLIDISCWTGLRACPEEEKMAVTKTWDDAFSSIGFAVVEGHGIPSALFEKLHEQWSSFFAMDNDRKMKFNRGAYGNPLGGYTPVGVEAVSRSNDGVFTLAPDNVESYVYKRQNIREETTEKRDLLSHEYFMEMESLIKILHRISASALGLPNIDFFDEFYSTQAPTSGNALRFAHYPPFTDDQYGLPNVAQRVDRYGAHTDYQGFTILHPDREDWTSESSGGLEIKLPQIDEWVKANLSTYRKSGSIGEMLIINSGDLIGRWTNDHWKSTLHRVASPISGSKAAAQSRHSVVFFSGPRDDSLISVLDLARLGPLNYDPILSGEHLTRKLSKTNV